MCGYLQRLQVPKQNNGWDCGVYMLMLGEHSFHNLEVIKTIQEGDLLNRRAPLERLVKKDEFTAEDVTDKRKIFEDLVDTFTEMYRKTEGLTGEAD